jgi:DMSO reductase anchor subunit
VNPALSVLLLTTLIGAGQGLFIALHALEWFGWAGRGGTGLGFFALGGVAVLALTGGGLVASFFHLGRPERAWRSAAMWRTSWLSREVIVLPLFMLGAFVWTVQHFAFGAGTLAVGAVTVALALALYVCTAMIYASLRFIPEWASVYTLVNYTLIGLASGTTFAAALAGFRAPALVPVLAPAALALTLAALAMRALSLRRNARLAAAAAGSTLQTAIGVRHPQLQQRSMGFMGGSFNTREFFHGRSLAFVRHVKATFLVAGFVVPMLALAAVAWRGFGDVANQWVLAAALAVQMPGLLTERWFFFAQARHPQNLYYQAVA